MTSVDKAAVNKSVFSWACFSFFPAFFFFPCSLLSFRVSPLVAAEVIFSFKHTFLCEVKNVFDFLSGLPYPRQYHRHSPSFLRSPSGHHEYPTAVSEIPESINPLCRNGA